MIDSKRSRELPAKLITNFAKGSGHPAKLNSGDCFVYALAETKREPLLFKSEDFSPTDVTIALA